MSDRRTSSRTRKQVDYSVSGENDFEGENDDDFAASSRGPAVKKLRIAKEKVIEKSKLMNSKQTLSSKSNDQTSKERLFERDMELVISLSKTPSDANKSHIEPVSVNSPSPSAPNSADVKVLQNTGSTADKETKGQQPESSCTDAMQHKKEEAISPMMKRNSQLSDDDALLSSSDVQSSEEDDDGSDSGSSSDDAKTKASSKKNTKAKLTKPTQSAKHISEKSRNSKIVKPVNPVSSSQKMMARLSQPRVNGGPVDIISNKQSLYSSPTSGVLRIGLSRNVKVKSLHQLNSPT